MSPPVKSDGRKKKSWSKTFWDHERGEGGGYIARGANKGRMREMEKIKQDSLRVFEFPFLRCCVFHGPLTPRSTQMFQGWGLLSPEPR